MEKINIYIPEKIGTIIDNDAVMFELFKKDERTINKNRFLSKLITGYYEDYSTEIKKAHSNIISVLDSSNLSTEEKEIIADSILKKTVLPTVPSRKGKNPVRLSLKPTKDTEVLIDKMMRDLGGTDYISQFFCRMIMSYCDKPFSKREQIIFKDNYNILLNACDKKRSITFKTIWNKDAIHEVIPYKVVTGPEELFNYLLCAEVNMETGAQEPRTYRLNRIDRIYYGRTMSLIDESVLYYLKLMNKYSPQYMICDDIETCVRLTDNGVRKFNRIYYGRPVIDHIVDKGTEHYYYFKCSKDQIFFYFRRFGFEDAEILSPADLRKRITEFHIQAANMYLER